MGTVTETRSTTDEICALQLASVTGWTWRVGQAWHQLRGAVQEMNYASRRMVELQQRLP
jgi:hypothetical protein